MASTIKLTVTTPEHQVLEETAESVVIPAHDGELGVLEARSPLMCDLGIGQLRYTKEGHTLRVYVDGGFAQINENVVTVLTPHALKPENITPEVLAEAERKLAELTADPTAGADERYKQRQRVGALREVRSQN